MVLLEYLNTALFVSLADSFTRLRIITHGGSTSFGNPGAVILPVAVGLSVGSTSPFVGGAAANGTRVIVASYFVFGQGAAVGEAGSLLFYRELPREC